MGTISILIAITIAITISSLCISCERGLDAPPGDNCRNPEHHDY